MPPQVPTKRPAAARKWHERLFTTGPLVLSALVSGWISVALLASKHYDSGMAAAAVASFLALLTVRAYQGEGGAQVQSLDRADDDVVWQSALRGIEPAQGYGRNAR